MPRYEAKEFLPHFCTITILDWLPILIDRPYIEPIIDSLRYCREKKGLQVFGFVIMPHHIHLIAAVDGDLHELIRDFKRFTSRKIHDRLKDDHRTTLLQWLDQATEPARRERGELGLWHPGFHPQSILTQSVFEQKLQYIHANPVRKGLVQLPDDWWYSSASCYSGRTPVCLPVDPLQW